MLGTGFGDGLPSRALRAAHRTDRGEVAASVACALSRLSCQYHSCALSRRPGERDCGRGRGRSGPVHTSHLVCDPPEWHWYQAGDLVIPRSRQNLSEVWFALRSAASPPPKSARRTRLRCCRRLHSWIIEPRRRLSDHRFPPPTVQAVLRQVAQVERERDLLAAANERLRNENIQLRAMDIAFRDLLNFADERAHGQLRVLVEQAGEQLADWLDAAIEQHT